MHPLTATNLNAQLPYLFGNEIQYFNKLGTELLDETVVMLGVGPALMALALLETAPAGVVLSGYDHADLSSAYAHVRAAELPQEIWFVNEDTAKASDYYFDGSVDLLLVDGDHTYEGVKRDIEAWWSKVKPGGLLFFHDYIKLEDDNGVAEALEACKNENWEEVEKVGISIVYRKIK
jgi:SAM-dependent methyltransferase